MQFLREHTFFTRCLFGLIALLLLNISIDLPTTSLAEGSFEKEYNKQESIVELVVEKVFDVEHAFSEHDDGDDDENTKKSTSFTELFLSNCTFTYSVVFFDLADVKPILLPEKLCSMLLEHRTPPPEC